MIARIIKGFIHRKESFRLVKWTDSYTSEEIGFFITSGESRDHGDAKCDLNLRPSTSNFDELIQQWEADSRTSILSDEAITLKSGLIGRCSVIDSLGRAVAVVVEIDQRLANLTCFGNFKPVDGIAQTLRGFFGIFFLIDPSGELVEMPVSHLDKLPIDTFILPGLFLLIVYGIGSSIITFGLIRQRSWAPFAGLLLGLVLMGWVICQIILWGEPAFLQYLYLTVGAGIFVLSLITIQILRGRLGELDM